MIRAYNELYLNDAQTFLANFLDYAICDCKIEPNLFSKIFVSNSLCKQFEHGNPAILSGKSGIEGARDLISEVIPNHRLPNATFKEDRSPAYWAGWVLAYYQWKTAKRFKNIFSRVPLTDILAMYHTFHEMDLTNFVDAMELRYNAVTFDTNIKKIREARGLSQRELSDLSGVNIRSIQLYEQRVNEIDRAQAQTLYKIAHVLCCDIEDLLERPEKDF